MGSNFIEPMKVERLAQKCGAFSFCIMFNNEK
jgi:hypothetical protein